MRRLCIAAITLSLMIAVSVEPAGAAFPGRNGKILYGTWHSDKCCRGPWLDYATMHPDGSGKKTILSGRRMGFQAQFSPDGKRIAFEEYQAPAGDNAPVGFGQMHVYVMNADGSKVRSTSDDLADESGPSWSPDGKQIVYTREGFGATRNAMTPDLWVMNPDGTDRRPLIEGLDWDYSPKWSPTGDRIAFIRYVETDPVAADGWFATLFVADANGRNVRQLVEIGGGDLVVYFDWSPDGRYIVFDWMKAPSYKTDLYIVRSDGTGLRRLVRTPKHDEFTPIWSPDGKKITFSSDEDGDYDVYVINVDGTGKRKLTHDEIDNEPYDWQSRR